MGIGERVKGLATDVQEGVKTSSVSLMNWLLRIVSGTILGTTLALIGQELAGYGSFMLLFVMLVVLSLFLRLSSSWSIPKVLIFDLICALVGQLLRMYILLAP